MNPDTKEVYPYMFLVDQPNAPQQANIMAKYIEANTDLRKAAVFYDQSNAYTAEPAFSMAAFKIYMASYPLTDLTIGSSPYASWYALKNGCALLQRGSWKHGFRKKGWNGLCIIFKCY